MLPLQWGRRWLSTDRLSEMPRSRRLSGFNGAVDGCRRIVADLAADDSRIVVASMGPSMVVDG